MISKKSIQKERKNFYGWNDERSNGIVSKIHALICFLEVYRVFHRLNQRICMQSVPIPVSHSLISHFFPRMISFKLLDCLLVILLALCVSATESFSNSCESVVTFTGDSISTSVNEDQPYSCSDSIPSEVAAYCVCNGGVKVHAVASAHEPFTCNEACSTTPPMTISK